MPRDPRLRFLLRASALLVLMLVVWWFALLKPLLMVQSVPVRWELGSEVSEVRLEPDGKWFLQTTQETDPGHYAYFALTPQTINLLTIGLPVFWALILAAPWSQLSWRVLGTGTVAMLVWINLAIFIESAVVLSLENAGHEPGALDYQLRLGAQLNRGVLPFLVPVLLAVGTHSGLRALILPDTKPLQSEPRP